MPRAQERARNFAELKFVNALAHARSGGVFGSRYVAMMALVVLDEEVPIANRGENDLGHPAVEVFLLVPEFVASIQHQPVDDPQGESDSHSLPQLERLRHAPPHSAEPRSIVHRRSDDPREEKKNII